ncbi:RING-H2 finger protein ATL1-like [Tasmannia lanceolata]|uniref:RING-H2 finger protein ATL1-like n=1 Tax=Tasmannia lanceolata TaxID=3420 RepID=UPI00406337ED
MADPFSPFMAPPPSDRGTKISPFYYTVIAIASTALLLICYNLFVLGWCLQHRRTRRRLDGSTGNVSGDLENPNRLLIPAYKYQKEEIQIQNSDNECAVCLSVFADGDELRQLPECKHSFHVGCIDMWLSSHSNCPLCRATIVVSRPQCRIMIDDDEEIFRPGYPGSSGML